MKFYLALLCTVGTGYLVAETPNNQYPDDVIVPKALQKTSSVAPALETTAVKPLLTHETQTVVENPSTSEALREIKEMDKKMFGDNLVYAEVDMNDSDVIIPPTFQSKYQQPNQAPREAPAAPKTVSQTATPPTPNNVAPKVFSHNTPLVAPGKVVDTCQAIQTGNTTIPNIEGVYTLDRGVERNIPLKHAVLVIERLDFDDFGYYYATQMQSFPASSYYGIFHYNQQKNKFLNKTYETNTTTQLHDNITIKFDEKQLETIVSISVGKRAIIWNKVGGAKDTEQLSYDTILKDAIYEAKNSYLELYKKHPCFLDQ